MIICPKCFVEIRVTEHICAAELKETLEKETKEQLLVRLRAIKEIATRLGAKQIIDLCSKG